jgi:uncharacterized protein
MPRNVVGPPVTGEDCFGREEFVDYLAESLKTSNVLVTAPRRWGKTSVLRVLRDRDPARRHYFDLYRVDRATAFVAEIAATMASPLDRVRQRVGEILGRSLDRVQEIRVFEMALELRERLAADTDWPATAMTILRTIPSDHLLILDEFPAMVKLILDRDKNEAEMLLRLLRVARQGDDAPRFVFAGSTSLAELCREAGLTHAINDLRLIPLPRFDRQTAAELLRRIFETEGVELSQTSLTTALDLVGPEVPYFLQVISSAMIADVRDSGRRITPAFIKRIYEDVLLGSDYRAYLDNFRARLDQSYLPEERNVALAILSTLSRERAGLNHQSLHNEIVTRNLNERLLDRVLVLLEGDFYISCTTDGRYKFLNQYLADWWERFHA